MWEITRQQREHNEPERHHELHRHVTPDFNTTEGTYTMSASFSGDSNYAGSGSSQTGNLRSPKQAPPLRFLLARIHRSVDQSVTFTATIDGQYGLIVQRNGALASSSSILKKRGLSSSRTWASTHTTISRLSGTVTWSANPG